MMITATGILDQFGCQTRKLVELVVRVTIFHADSLSDLISSLFQCKVYGSDASCWCFG